MRKILRGAIVLLIAIAIFFSTIDVTADTIQDQLKEIPKSKPVPLIKQNSPKPLGDVEILSEGFESGVFPPYGWSIDQYNPSWTWMAGTHDPHSGSYHAVCYYDDNLEYQYEMLFTPIIDFTQYTLVYLKFWWAMSYYWSVDPYDNYNFQVFVTTDKNTFTLVFDEHWIGPFEDYEWYDTIEPFHYIDLSDFSGEPIVWIAFLYEGLDGDAIWLDDILIGGNELNPPTAPTITGPPWCYPNASITYYFQSNDDSNRVYYHIDWGDTTSEWTGWHVSGTQVDVVHTYNKSGNYTITAYAEDLWGNIGPESTFLIVCPRDKAINRPFLNWFQSHPNMFPLLQKLIQNLGL